MEIFFAVILGVRDDALGIYWAEVRDIVKYPIMHRIASTTRNFLVANVSDSKVVKLQGVISDLVSINYFFSS
jgi:hypothetical protein